MAEHKFEGGIQGYLVNQMSRNLWRVAAIMTDDDFLQDGYLLFRKIADRYPDVEPAHFMALYKTALANRITDLANESTRQRTMFHRTEVEVGGQRFDLEVMGETDNDGYLSVVMRQAPTEVVQVLTLFMSAPTELLELAMSTWRRNGRLEAGGNKQVAQWLGMPDGSKPLDAVRNYFESV